eukprot:TRINITY_DN104203_c0_g1_i1.p1 TRINITY_DN104203_c0_g1~~TRINITY_DN104203_c0_g1_i1.p1  ORF type:complete len:182 (-),score=35.79 TRINITY_DN104203_c0_g1_i1:453-998(-)
MYFGAMPDAVHEVCMTSNFTAMPAASPVGTATQSSVPRRATRPSRSFISRLRVLFGQERDLPLLQQADDDGGVADARRRMDDQGLSNSGTPLPATENTDDAAGPYRGDGKENLVATMMTAGAAAGDRAGGPGREHGQESFWGMMAAAFQYSAHPNALAAVPANAARGWSSSSTVPTLSLRF